MTEALLAMCAFLTLLNIVVSGFVSVVAATMVYSWFRKLQATKDRLPALLQDAVDDLAARYIEPRKEVIEADGRATTEPNKPTPTDHITLDEDYNSWIALP